MAWIFGIWAVYKGRGGAVKGLAGLVVVFQTVRLINKLNTERKAVRNFTCDNRVFD
jgi:hypothetical protein